MVSWEHLSPPRLRVWACDILESDSWWHTAAKALLWSSVPVGIFLSYIANRFSIVEGCAGDAGYNDLETNHESKTRD